MKKSDLKKLIALAESEADRLKTLAEVKAKLLERKAKMDDKLTPEVRLGHFEDNLTHVPILQYFSREAADALHQKIVFLKAVGSWVVDAIIEIAILEAARSGEVQPLHDAFFTYNRICYGKRLQSAHGYNHAGNFKDVVYALAACDLALVQRYFAEKFGLPDKNVYNFYRPACSLVMTMLYQRDDWKVESKAQAEAFLVLKSANVYDKVAVRYLLALLERDVSAAGQYLQEFAENYKRMSGLFNFKSAYFKFFAAYVHGLYNLAYFVLDAADFARLQVPVRDTFWENLRQYQAGIGFAPGRPVLDFQQESEGMEALFAFSDEGLRRQVPETAPKPEQFQESVPAQEARSAAEQHPNFSFYKILAWYRYRLQEPVNALAEQTVKDIPFFEFEYFTKYEFPAPLKLLYSMYNGEEGTGRGAFFGHQVMSLAEIIEVLKFSKTLVKPDSPSLPYPHSSARLVQDICNLFTQYIPEDISSWHRIEFECNLGGSRGPYLYRSEATTDRDRQVYRLPLEAHRKLKALVTELKSFEDATYNWDWLACVVYPNGDKEVKRRYTNYAEEFAVTSSPEKAIRKKYFHDRWVPIISDHGGNYIGIDLDPDENGVTGQVIVFGRDDTHMFVLANSWHEFLALTDAAIERNPTQFLQKKHLHEVFRSLVAFGWQ